MVNIIIRKSGSSGRFVPHMNHAMGKYYHTSKDYLGDMKAKGMEPYRPQDVKTKLKAQEGYKPSEWAKKMTAVGVKQVKEHGKTSGSFNAAMGKHLKTSVPSKIARQTKGGSYTE